MAFPPGPRRATNSWARTDGPEGRAWRLTRALPPRRQCRDSLKIAVAFWFLIARGMRQRATYAPLRARARGIGIFRARGPRRFCRSPRVFVRDVCCARETNAGQTRPEPTNAAGARRAYFRLGGGRAVVLEYMAAETHTLTQAALLRKSKQIAVGNFSILLRQHIFCERPSLAGGREQNPTRGARFASRAAGVLINT